VRFTATRGGDLLADTGKEAVMADVIGWLNARIA
jgi:hypothetical protein